MKWLIDKDTVEKARVFESVMRMPGFLLFVTNSKFELLYANSYFYSFFDCKAEDLLGKPLYGFLNDDARPCISEDHIDSVIKEGYIWEHVAATSKPNGEPATVMWNQSYLHDKKNPSIVTFGLVRETAGIPEDSISGDDSRSSRDIFPKSNTYISANMPPAAKTVVSEHEIQYALDNNAFELFYQPMIHARTKQIIGAEALLRMNHPTRGRLFPADVLPTAEKTGQVVPIGNFAINAACLKIKEWTAAGFNLTIAVNLSYRQFTNENLAETILRAVTLHDVAAGHLLLDVTEDSVSRDPDKTREIFKTLQQLGCKICLDDFGTGFSSLRNLESLEIDSLKIDRSFLPSEGNSRKSYALVESLIMLAHGLGFSVTASGIETEVQAETLLEMACDHFQGYLFSRPVSEKEFDRLLRTPDFYVRNV